jgi:RNA polymerase sigma-70 factor (ECF subfamily)
VRESLADTIEAVYRSERRRVLATLIRLLGSFDAAEDAVQDAFAIAAQKWPTEGIPANPYAWLVSTGRFRTIDRWRRRAKIAAALPELAALSEGVVGMPEPDAIRDDELRLIFICCHPSIPPDARIALTLREVGGLTTEEIARAYLTRPVTIAQRIVRAKAKISESRIPYVVPDRTELPARLGSALHVLYLIFNEGYAATAGQSLTRADFCTEAIRLAKLITELLEDSEALGLLALMLIHEARRASRIDGNGDLILLEDQDRSLWNAEGIGEAQSLIDRAFAMRSVGPYLLQAAIASIHAAAPSFARTDWAQIVALYDVLFRIEPSPVVALNQAIAIGMRDGADEGLRRVDALLGSGDLLEYAPAHAARADFLQKLGRNGDARGAYEHAMSHTEQPAEKRFFAKRIALLGQSP